MLFATLDDLTSGGFVPYRDGADVVRLLDINPPRSNPCPLSRTLHKQAVAALEAGLAVATEADYRAWYDAHGGPFYSACTRAMLLLGACMGDEGREWSDTSNRLIDAVHQPGWKL